MEKDTVETIETAASTNNEGNEEDSIPVELVDKEERFHDGYGDGEPVTIRFRMKYKYNKNGLPTMEKDVADAIDTAASTKNEGKEDDSIPVELVDDEEIFRRRRTPISNISISIPVPTTTEIDFRPWKRMLLRR